MSITTKCVEEIGIEKETADKIFAEHGKAIELKKGEITTLQSKLTELGEQIKGAPSSETLKELQDKVSQYEENDRKRREAEEEANTRNTSFAQLDGSLGERKFVNERTKNSVYEDVMLQIAKTENKAKEIGRAHV